VKFEWDENKRAQVEAERGITQKDVEQAFSDERAFDFYDESHSINENRYIVIGLSSKGLLTVPYTIRERNGEEIYRIITAWHSTREEEKLYEEG